jgi:hypothetical protein
MINIIERANRLLKELECIKQSKPFTGYNNKTRLPWYAYSKRDDQLFGVYKTTVQSTIDKCSCENRKLNYYHKANAVQTKYRKRHRSGNI